MSEGVAHCPQRLLCILPHPRSALTVAAFNVVAGEEGQLGRGAEKLTKPHSCDAYEKAEIRTSFSSYLLQQQPQTLNCTMEGQRCELVGH